MQCPLLKARHDIYIWMQYISRPLSGAKGMQGLSTAASPTMGQQHKGNLHIFPRLVAKMRHTLLYYRCGRGREKRDKQQKKSNVYKMPKPLVLGHQKKQNTSMQIMSKRKQRDTHVCPLVYSCFTRKWMTSPKADFPSSTVCTLGSASTRS